MFTEDYFGNNLTADQYDSLAISAINEKFLKLESALFLGKWFDNRHLHPTQATYLFAHHYELEYKKVFKRIRDHERGQYVKGTKGKDCMLKKEVTGFWKGRQNADRLGIPYDIYIGSVMKFLIEDNIWQRIPRPTHLYSAKVTEFMKDKWVQMLGTEIIQPEIAHLSDDNLFGTQCKLEIERYLCGCIQMRKNGHLALSRYMCELNMITEQTALQYFSELTIQKAKKFYLE